MKNELERKITVMFVGLRAKVYSYLTDGSSEDKKTKDTKKRVIKKPLNLKFTKTVWKQLNLRIK